MEYYISTTDKNGKIHILSNDEHVAITNNRNLLTNNCKDVLSQLEADKNNDMGYMLTYILNEDCSIKDIKITPKTKENEYACFIKDKGDD